MSALVWGHDDTCLQWLHKRWGGDIGRVPQAVVGITDPQGVLRGAILLWQENAFCWEFGLYSEGVIAPRLVREFFCVVFGPLGASRLQIRTPRDHLRLKKLIPKFGFRFECVARDFYGSGSDALQFSMQPATCRWIDYEQVKAAKI